MDSACTYTPFINAIARVEVNGRLSVVDGVTAKSTRLNQRASTNQIAKNVDENPRRDESIRGKG